MASPRPEEHLAAYAALQRATDREILAALKLAYRDVGRQLGVLARQGSTDASLERERLLAVKKAILEAQATFYNRTGDIIARRRVEAAARAIQVSQRYDQAVFRLAGREDDLLALSEGLEETEARAPERMIARLTGSRIPLSERVYRTRAYTQGLLDARINSGLARGLSAQQLAREVQDLVNPATPGGVRFAALRLARTEINNAYHAMAIRAAELKPWVTGLEWHTSDSHPRPDECDRLNKQVFSPPSETPRKPHPQCMCYVTQVIGDPEKSDEENDEEFLDGLFEGLFDGPIDDIISGNQPPPQPAKAVPAKAVKKAAKTAKKAPAKATKKAAPAKKAAKVAPAKKQVPAKKAAPVASEQFVVPHMANVPEGEHAARLTSEPALRRELDLQEAITPNCASQLFLVEVHDGLGAGTGGLHNRALRRIQISTGNRDGLTGRDVYNKAERNGFHPACGAEHNTAQLHLAHEYGHHVHQMLDFMPIDDREDLRDLIADELGVPRPARADRDHPLFNPEHLELLTYWMADHRDVIERTFGSYAGKNEREMLAEIWSAYSTNPETNNKAIKAIGARMRQLGEAGAQRGRVNRPDEDAKRLEALADRLKKAMEMGLL